MWNCIFSPRYRRLLLSFFPYWLFLFFFPVGYLFFTPVLLRTPFVFFRLSLPVKRLTEDPSFFFLSFPRVCLVLCDPQVCFDLLFPAPRFFFNRRSFRHAISSFAPSFPWPGVLVFRVFTPRWRLEHFFVGFHSLFSVAPATGFQAPVFFNLVNNLISNVMFCPDCLFSNRTPPPFFRIVPLGACFFPLVLAVTCPTSSRLRGAGFLTLPTFSSPIPDFLSVLVRWLSGPLFFLCFWVPLFVVWFLFFPAPFFFLFPSSVSPNAPIFRSNSFFGFGSQPSIPPPPFLLAFFFSPCSPRQ